MKPADTNHQVVARRPAWRGELRPICGRQATVLIFQTDLAISRDVLSESTNQPKSVV